MGSSGETNSGKKWTPETFERALRKAMVTSNSNPYSSTNIMTAEMKEQEEKQRKVEDGRPLNVKLILKQMGYEIL